MFLCRAYMLHLFQPAASDLWNLFQGMVIWEETDWNNSEWESRSGKVYSQTVNVQSSRENAKLTQMSK